MKPYDIGWQAYLSGIFRAHNPFIDEYLKQEWDEGWCASLRYHSGIIIPLS